MSLTDFLRTVPGLSDAAALAAYHAQPPAPRSSNVNTTYATYLSIGKLIGNNAAGRMRAELRAWANNAADLSDVNPALPNPSALMVLHERLDGYPGVDLSDAEAPAMLALFAGTPDLSALGFAPFLTAEAVRAILSVGYVLVAPATPEQVTAARALIARADAVAAERARVMAYLNDVLNVGEADPAAPLVTARDYFAAT